MKPFIMDDPATAPTLDAARLAFTAGRPYVQAAGILSRIAATAYARGIGSRPPLKFRGEVQLENFLGRARDAAIEAAATWQPRDRRAGFGVFKDHVFAAVDTALRKPTAPQGRATGGTQPKPARSDGKPDTRNNPDGAFDIGAAVASGEDEPLADERTLDAFEKVFDKKMRRMATGVRPYTDMSVGRYAQQRGYSISEVQDARIALRMFLESQVVPSALDFKGVFPHPPHWLAQGLVTLELPGIPPRGDKVLGPWAKPNVPDRPGSVLIAAAFIERDKNGDPQVRKTKMDGSLQPEAQEYFAKLLRWGLRISEYFIEQDRRVKAKANWVEGAREVEAARKEMNERMKKSEVGSAALAVDARRAGMKAERKAAAKLLKSKKSTQKP